MSTDTKPSAGAMRAADFINGIAGSQRPPVYMMAQIIDRETHELVEALENIYCPDCDHILARHLDRYGCEVEPGDRGPCACKGDGVEILEAIVALRRFKEGL